MNPDKKSPLPGSQGTKTGALPSNAPGQTPLIGAAYIRVSTDEQLDLSPDSQLREIKKYADAHNITLNRDFLFMEEEGRSGRSASHRPEFLRMIGIAKQNPKPFDVILVWKYSRFARNQEESIVYKALLRQKCGINVVSVSEPLIEGPFGSLIERIIEWMDEYYSVRLSGEVLRGMQEKFSRGGVVSAPPFGYLMGDHLYLPDPDLAPVVRQVFHDFINGAGYKQLAERLNAMGYRTKRGGQIENRFIMYMLKNPVYLGKLRWSAGKKGWDSDLLNQSIVDGRHEALIDSATWDAAQARIADLKAMYPRYARQVTGGVMLQGLIRCSVCGSTLVRSGKGLQCYRYARGACAVSHYIDLRTANERVLEMLERSFREKDLTIIVRDTEKRADELTAIKAQLQRERAKLNRIRAAYEDGIDSLDEYKEKKGRIQQTISDLEAKLSQQPAKISIAQYIKERQPSLKKLRDPQLTEDEKNAVLRSFVDHIVFDRTHNQFSIVCYA